MKYQDIKEVKIIEVNVPKNDPNQEPLLAYLGDGSLLGEIIPESICDEGAYVSIYSNENISSSYKEIVEYMEVLNTLIDTVSVDEDNQNYQFGSDNTDIENAAEVLQTYSDDEIRQICCNQHFVAGKLLDAVIKFTIAIHTDEDPQPNDLLISSLVQVMRNYHKFSGYIIKYGSEDTVNAGSFCAANNFFSLASIMRGEQLEFIDGKICLFREIDFA